VLIGEHKVDWGYGLLMAAGALLGGYLGASLVRGMNRTAVRAVIITIGLGVAAIYFCRLYGTAVLDMMGG
jgi:uncharacterized membrane protein YfcA